MPGSLLSPNARRAEREVPGTAEPQNDGGPGLRRDYVTPVGPSLEGSHSPKNLLPELTWQLP